MESRVPARLSPAEGRRFAFPVGTAFLALAGITWWRDMIPLALGFSAAGALLLLAGFAVPGRLGPVFRAWMAFALLLSKVTSPIFLGIIYFLVLAPTGFLIRIFGRNPIVRKPADGSYWVPRPEGSRRRSDLKRQF